ncbi:MAG TPA: TfuA-like protein [Streptosporangiaceae bacterium]|nr:TfuA-like protein [Streptosporangiaceae bacterium]
MALGDVLRAIDAGFTTLVLIDGFFHGQPAVWHKEIMYGLSRGCAVVGCSSMGALRAAELAAYGMQGHGEIFAQFYNGQLDGDDEVAVAHSDHESGYRCLSEPLVNIRHGIDLAVRTGMLSAHAARGLLAASKATFYADRHWERVLRAAAEQGLPVDDVAALREFIAANDLDLKRKDAVQTLRWVARGGHESGPVDAEPFTFEETYSWRLLRMTEGTSGP